MSENLSVEIDSYIEKAADFAKPILIKIRELVHKSCPEITECIKWSFPNFEYKGQILCSMAAHKKHCSFGLWRGNEIEDTDKILQQIGKTAMGQLGQLRSIADLPSDEILIKYLQQAIDLCLKVKTKSSSNSDNKNKKSIPVPEIPDYLNELLEKCPEAKINFEKFSNSCKREYVVWITEAKTEKTRQKRLSEALEMIKEGKQRNWKYQKGL
jgi:uncharacterized protein YdeI (YjbR/CyaY-like superfamily)